MRTLVIMRGAPGSGKSTFIRQNGLEPYTISSDTIRLLCEAPAMSLNTTSGISINNEELTWSMLHKVLENRMRTGSFTVVDATHTGAKDFSNYKKLAETYRYRVYCIDMSDISREELIRRNEKREPLRQVPVSAIDKMLNRLANNKVPSWVTVIKPEDLSQIFMQPIDLSGYKKVHHIGDIHGSYTVLQNYLDENGGLKEDEYYIYVGDYIDRGVENVEVINFLLSIYNKPNVCLLEGNHERWIRKWAQGEAGGSREFEKVTRPQLDEATLNLKEARQLCRKFRQCMYYTYQGKKVIVTHGGLSTLPENITFVSTVQMINGVGKYEEMLSCNEAFLNSTDSNVYQVHGHRNTELHPIEINERCFNLCDEVEFGGNLRCLQLSSEGFKSFMIPNPVFRIIEKPKPLEDKTVGEIIADLRGSTLIQEKHFGNISSFNFTRDAFFDKTWNEQTIKARGLYIDTVQEKVAARSYEKFFNVNEVEVTKINNLSKSLVFPATAYVKENGFLGIVSHDEMQDKLLIATKSNIGGEYAQWFEALLKETYSTETLYKMDSYCKEHNVSFVFECVDMKNDPHIIDYSESKVILLDIVANSITFSKLDYDTLCHVANTIGLKVKEKAIELTSWEEFMDWYRYINRHDYTYNGSEIEGFVIEDSEGFMFKVKLKYYTFWKCMRRVAEQVNKTGMLSRLDLISTQEAAQFYRWLQGLHDSGITFNPQNICKLRRDFYSQIRKN